MNPYLRPTANSMHRGAGNGGGGRDRVNEANEGLLEEENNARWEELGAQVNMLKSLTVDINSEVKSQNSFLDEMGGSMNMSSDLIKGTIGKIGQMINNPSSKHMWYLVGFMVGLFLLITFFMGK